MSMPDISTARDPGFQHTLADDASVHAQIQDWLDIEYSQIDAGEFAGQITRRQMGPVTFFREYQNKAVLKRGHVPSNLCTVSMVDQGNQSGWFMRHTMEGDDSLFLMPSDMDVDLLVPGDITSTYAVMDERELLAGIRALGVESWEGGVGELRMYNSSGSRQQLAQLADIALHQGDVASKLPYEDHGQMLLHQFALIIHEAAMASAAPAGAAPLRERRLEVVRSTRDYIVACLDAHYSPSVVDICNNVGVCARVLQYSFREFLRITPVAYLRILRLNKVREQLLAPFNTDITVTDVATRFGFLHLSKFSRDYAILFGERPSATLQRALR